MNRRTPLILLAAAFICSILSFAQDSQQERQSGLPQVSFDLKWPAADPSSFQITVDSEGTTTYRSQPRSDEKEPAADPFEQSFTMTSATRDQIFGLARELNYFRGDFAYKGNIRIADTGTKTLRYIADGKTNSASFNYSENKELMELAAVFQRISTTIESGRRLAFALRFDKMGIDQQLKNLESLQKSGMLAELQVIAPVLKRAIEDRSTMNISRQRAQKLLQAGQGLSN